ncbi:hypothetical protein CN325_13915 [Bacillus thuringiensis]|uniref:hypothetical protein n=1 Tax=Bacillus thuringiensis TaxID=1428 RepID=UPI000BF40602|nr:hypothetical protein [Bacillus thuringiensis]PFE96658.1 hypothetical protein CN325_13915 [Bacillus thuringiensis]
MNMLLKGKLFMLTLDRLLNVTIYLGVFLLFISFITFVIKRGPDLLFFQFGISLFFGAQIIIGMKFFHNYGFSFHSKLELLIFIFYVIGFITCILLFFNFQNPYRIFLLICSFLFLTGSNYYFKETLNFSKKTPKQHKTFLSTQEDSFPKEVRKFSEDYNNIIRNDFYEIPMIPTELQITSKKDSSHSTSFLVELHNNENEITDDSVQLTPSERFYILLNTQKTKISKIVYEGQNFFTFTVTLKALNLQQEPEIHNMFLEIDKRRAMNLLNFEIKAHTKEWKVTFKSDNSSSNLPITFNFEKRTGKL